MLPQLKTVTQTRRRLIPNSRTGLGRKSLSRTSNSFRVKRWSCKVSESSTKFQKNRFMDNFFWRVLLRSDVRHPVARPPLCHRKLHRLSLQCIWLCHQGKHHHHHQIISQSSGCYATPVSIKLSSQSSQWRFADPDPNDLNHCVHERENCEDHSKCSGSLHPRGNSHLHFVYIQRGNLQGGNVFQNDNSFVFETKLKRLLAPTEAVYFTMCHSCSARH